MLQVSVWLLLTLSLMGCALGSLSSQLIASSRPDQTLGHLRVRDNTITSIRKIIEEEISYNVYTGYLGLAPETAALSCKEIADKKPDYQSGYYWIKGSAGPLGVYCEMSPIQFEQEGGWMKVAGVDMRNPQDKCPIGLTLNTTGSKRTCSRPNPAPGCSTSSFSVHGVGYKKVCGKVIGYQSKLTNGFGPARSTPGIDQTYVDGVSITHGMPRQHIWTLASSIGELGYSPDNYSSCPCIFPQRFESVIPSFVGGDYYCETGNRGRGTTDTPLFSEDPLWDGRGCGGNSSCCQRGGPWFCKELGSTSSSDIELRVCMNNAPPNEEVLLEQIDLYIQ